MYLTEHNYYIFILFQQSEPKWTSPFISVLGNDPSSSLVQLILKPYSQSYRHNLFFFQASGILLISISCLEALSHLLWQHDQPKSVIFSKLHWNRDPASLFSSSFFLLHNFPFKDLLIQSWLKAYNILFLLLLSSPSFLPTCRSSVIKTMRAALSPGLWVQGFYCSISRGTPGQSSGLHTTPLGHYSDIISTSQVSVVHGIQMKEWFHGSVIWIT